MAKQRDHSALEQRRLQAAQLFQKGVYPAEVARRLGVRRQSAHQWFKAWQARGKEGLKSRGSAGRKSRLSPQQLELIRAALIAGPVKRGYKTDLWTLPRVAHLIEDLTGQRYHPGHVWHLLRSLGMSCQQPTRRAVERDEAKITEWKKRTWPAIKKKRAAKAGPPSSSTKAA
jgi:transposase